MVGTDEAFFEDDRNDQSRARPLHREGRHPRRRRGHRSRPGLLRLPDLEERHRPPTRSLEKIIPDLPPVVYSTKPHQPADERARRRPGLPAHRRGQRRPGLGGQERRRASPSRSSTILEAAECAPGHARPAAAREPPRAGPPGRGAGPDRGEVRRRAAGPPVRRALPHLRAAQALRRRGQGHALRHARNCTGPSRTSTATRCARRPPTPSTASCERHHRRGPAPSWSSPCATTDRLCRQGAKSRVAGAADHLLAGPVAAQGGT